MKLYCNSESVILAYHEDSQDIPASAYGENVQIVFYYGDIEDLERYGEAPRPGDIDMRPYLAPSATKESLKAYLANKRRSVEISSITLPNGSIVRTDAESQSKLCNTIVALDIGAVSAPIKWKSQNGWATLSRDDLVAVASAVATHVQACFNLEEQLEQEIEAGEITTYVEIDDWFAEL